MSSHIFINTRLILAKISPFTYFQRRILKGQRQRTLKELNQEKIYILDVEIDKQKGSLKELNLKWSNLQQAIEKGMYQAKALPAGSENAEKAKQNFITFVQKLDKTKDIETRIAALERVVEKIEEFQGENSPSRLIAGKHNYSLKLFKMILGQYLKMLETELKYWQVQDKIEELKVEQTELAEKV